MGDQLFKDKYRIKSIRLPDWNYGSDGAYFITICVKNRKCVFGEIINGKMELSKMGKIVLDEWIKTEQMRSNVELDKFVVMPNHVHGIVIIQCNDVETHSHASLQGQFKNKFGPQSKNLAAIVRGFKGTTTKQIHSAGFCDFAWQPRYYEHIIRNEKALNSIREYIINNPLQWELDKNNPNNPKSLKNH